MFEGSERAERWMEFEMDRQRTWSSFSMCLDPASAWLRGLCLPTYAMSSAPCPLRRDLCAIIMHLLYDIPSAIITRSVGSATRPVTSH